MAGAAKMLGSSRGIKQAKGEVKKVTGEVIGHGSLEQKGKIESAAGEIQALHGDLEAGLEKAE